jgi:hypothetical protein
MAGPWDSAPAPNYAAFPNDVGNALGNLVSSYQQAQQGQQRTKANDLRNQEDQMLLTQQKAFAGGVPMNPDGTPNYSAIMKTLAEKGDINSISALAPIIQQQQDRQGVNAPSPLQWGSGSSGSGGGSSVSPPAAGPWSGNQFLSTLVGAESEGNNSAVGDSGAAKGDFQFHEETWQKYAKNVPGADKYASAEDAPADVQQAVAETAPISEWGQRTRTILHAKFGPFDESQTIGQLAGEFGDGKGGGTQVAALGGSDATAYASPDKPSIPPVSAAAGSSIPRESASTAPGAVGGPSPGPTPVPQQLAANNPAWGGINAALPVGSGAPAQAPAAPTPQAPAPPSQGSVASIAAQVGIPAPVAANIAKAVGAAPDAPLTPEQAARAKTIIQNYAQRAQVGQQQQQQQGAPQGQGQPSAGGPIIPQFPLPKGYTDPQQAILAIDQEIARLGRFGPAAATQIKSLEDRRDRIAASSAPMEVRPGETILDPRTGQTRFQSAPASASNVALQRFLAENPDATAEQIQQFMQAGRGGARSGIGMYMQRYLQEHPDASDDDVKKAAQDYQSEGSALTKFTSGPQGNAIRSFNVVVDHLGTLGEAAAALKNGNLKLFNQIAQTVAEQTGSPAPTNFEATRELVGDEIVKAVVGSGSGALGDRDAIKATVNKANSPQALAGVIDQYRKLGLGQLKGLGLQYSEATGRDDFDRFLAPGTKAFFEGDGGKKPDQGDGQGSPGGLPAGWSVEVH